VSGPSEPEATPERPDILPLPIEPDVDVGSERLAEALAAMDIAAIGRALRQDYVIVPLLRGTDGGTQTRVLASDDPDGERAWELCIFSSAKAFGDFLADDAEREFAIRKGSSLTPFLERHRHLLRRVVFDPAGPHPVQAAVDDVIAALAPDPGDDDVAWITAQDGMPAKGLRPGERVSGLDLALGEDWAVIDLTDPRRAERDTRALVKRQLAGLPQAPVLRGQLTAWLSSTMRTATRAGGTRMAYLVRRSESAAAALSFVQYWHDLGPRADGTHLDDTIVRLTENLRPGDDLVRAETASGPFVRLTSERSGPAELGGLPVAIIDYWLEFPDHRGLAVVSFSTPHVDALEPIRLLADNIVLGAQWELVPAGEATTGHRGATAPPDR
jgi:hypothetical protein